MQFMTFPREVWAEIEGKWQRCLGLSMDGMVLMEIDGEQGVEQGVEQKILRYDFVLRGDLLWPKSL